MLVALAVAMLGFTSCRSDLADGFSFETQLLKVELESAIELANYRYERTGGDANSDRLGEIKRMADQTADRLLLARAAHAELLMEVDALDKDLAVFRRKAINDQRMRALRHKFPELVTGTGRSYLDASIASVTDAGVVVRHRNGSARLLYADLTPEQRVLFALEADSSLAAEQLERKVAAENELALDRRIAAAAEARQAAETLTAARRPTQISSAAAIDAFPSQVRPVSLLSMPPRSFGRSSRSDRFRDTYYDERGYFSRRPTIFYPAPNAAACPVRPSGSLNSPAPNPAQRPPVPRIQGPGNPTVPVPCP